jgi:alpha-D-ribose 1-methylphosphonate 5-triphosphate synthase subunit PhnH
VSDTGFAPAASPAALAPIAEWPMLQELDSDTAQRVFHAAMEAFARPGTIRRLPTACVPAPVPAVLAPLLALADIMTPVVAVSSIAAGAHDREVDAALALAARLVNAQVVAPAQARFGLAFGEPDDLSSLNRGSHWSPEAGAMLFQRVTMLETAALDSATDAAPNALWRLTGPGIRRGSPVLLRVGGLSARFVAERAARVDDYPAGIDVLLVTDEGAIVGLPRTTAITPIDAVPATAHAEADGAI